MCVPAPAAAGSFQIGLPVDRPRLVDATLINPTGHALAGTSVLADQAYRALDLVVLDDYLEFDRAGDAFAQLNGIALLATALRLQESLDVGRGQSLPTIDNDLMCGLAGTLGSISAP